MKSYNGFTPYQRQQHHDWLKAAIKMGVIPEPKVCKACGQTDGKVEYHVEDYNWNFQPGVPLCLRCHCVVHLRDRYPDFWGAYRKAVAEGARFEPARSFADVLEHVRTGVIDSTYFDVDVAPSIDILGWIENGHGKPIAIVKPPRNWKQLVYEEIGLMP